ncbi:MAG: DoxX family protein [Planctomycetota bacterium]
MKKFHAGLPLFGRLLLATIFVLSGFMKITHFGYMEGMLKGFPAPAFFLAAALTVELLGGLALVFGLFARPAAALLFLYLIPTTLIFHNFWAAADPNLFQMQFINFLKNLAIMGGLLYTTAYGAGLYSLDALRARHAHHAHQGEVVEAHAH